MEQCCLIDAGEDRTVKAYSSLLDLEVGNGDNVQIKCNDLYGPPIGRYYGEDQTGTVYSSKRKMYIGFTGVTNGTGFTFYYKSSAEEQIPSCNDNEEAVVHAFWIIVGIVIAVIVLIIVVIIVVVAIVVCVVKKWKSRGNIAMTSQ